MTIAADGSFLYDASGATAIQALPAGATLDDSFTYQVVDSQGGTATGTAVLTVQGINDDPVVADDQFPSVDGGTLLVVPAAGGLLSNDYDVDSPIVIDLVVSDTVSAGGAKVTLGPDGSFQYDPSGVLDYLPAGAVLDDSFSYTVIDDQGGNSQGTVHLEVVGVNDPPVAGDDTIDRGYWTVPTQPLFVSADSGLLVNDTDVDLGDQLRASFTGTSQYGASVEVFPDGSFRYDPTNSAVIQQFLADGIDVVDSFVYTLSDEGGTTSGTNGSSGSGEGEGGVVVQGVVEILLRSGASGYSFDVVAKQGETFDGRLVNGLGQGPSINNYGNVAFQATIGDQQNLYIWSDGSQDGRRAGVFSLVNPGFFDAFVPSRGWTRTIIKRPLGTFCRERTAQRLECRGRASAA